MIIKENQNNFDMLKAVEASAVRKTLDIKTTSAESFDESQIDQEPAQQEPKPKPRKTSKPSVAQRQKNVTTKDLEEKFSDLQVQHASLQWMIA